MIIDSGTIQKAFFSCENDLSTHQIIIKDGLKYDVLSKEELKRQNKQHLKLGLGEILSCLLKQAIQNSPQINFSDTYLISKYFIKRKSLEVNNRLYNFFCRIYNFFKGNGFYTNLEIAQKIQDTLKKNAVAIQFPYHKLLPKIWHGFQANLDMAKHIRMQREAAVATKQLKLLPSSAPNVSAITYNFTGGRFGDNLLSYLKGKYASIQWCIPLLYKPFEFSDQFNFDEFESRLTESPISFKNHVTYKKSEDLDDLEMDHRQNSTLYSLPWDDYYETNWEDPTFLKEIQPFVKLKKDFPVVNLPKDRVPVALHVRKGGGFDCEWDFKVQPTKFPSETYYVDALKKVSSHYNGKPLFVYLFTDDPNPKAIAEYYQKQLPELNLTFDFRKENNAHNLNILEDWSAMTQYEVLIRPDSSFSYTAEILGNHKVILHPVINKDKALLGKLGIDLGFKIKAT